MRSKSASRFIARRLSVVPLIVLLLASCHFGTEPNGIEGSGTRNTPPPPPPQGVTIKSFDPSGAPAGGSAFYLWVYGSNFAAGSVVRWNGSDRPTTVVDASTLEAEIPASDIGSAGTAAITVFNSAPGGGSSNALTFITHSGGVFPASVAVDPTGKFAYVANFGFAGSFVGNVSTYTIDPTTGTLTSIGAPVNATQGPLAVAVHPSGKFVYVVGSGDQGGGEDVGAVSMYTADATTGALALVGIKRGAGGTTQLLSPYSIAVDPSGKFAYVPSEGGLAPTVVSMLSIDATTGALTIIGTVSGEGRALSIAVDPKGKFAYVVTEDAGVSMYTVDGSTGILAFIGAVAAGAGPVSAVVHPTGEFAYVTNSGSDDVSMYTIDGTSGILTARGRITAGTHPGFIAVDPTGKFSYVTNSGSNNISMYRIDAATGALSSIGTIPAGLSPTSIAIHPNGNFAYVTNSDSNDVSMYSLDSVTGVLTLMGAIGT